MIIQSKKLCLSGSQHGGVYSSQILNMSYFYYPTDNIIPNLNLNHEFEPNKGLDIYSK